MSVVSKEKLGPVRRRARYPKQFRRDAASLVIDQHCLTSSGATSPQVSQQCAPVVTSPTTGGRPRIHDYHRRC